MNRPLVEVPTELLRKAIRVIDVANGDAFKIKRVLETELTADYSGMGFLDLVNELVDMRSEGTPSIDGMAIEEMALVLVMEVGIEDSEEWEEWLKETFGDNS
jgi:hypothetical protein